MPSAEYAVLTCSAPATLAVARFDPVIVFAWRSLPSSDPLVTLGLLTEFAERSVPLTLPVMMLECFPVGGLWPEIVLGPTWLLDEMTKDARAVPPPRTRKSAS